MNQLLLLNHLKMEQDVKSDYTYKRELIKNIMKALATRKLSYNFEFWIYDNKMSKLIL